MTGSQSTPPGAIVLDTNVISELMRPAQDVLGGAADDVFGAFRDQVLPFDAAATAWLSLREIPTIFGS